MFKSKLILCFLLVFILYSMPGYGTITYEWCFGDGQCSNEDEECPSHVYGSPGKYDWTFTIFQDGVPVCTDYGTICINQYEWDFGDGTISNAKNPQHRYAEPGEYTWTFTYINCEGEICTTYGTIIITDPPSIFTITSPNGGEIILPFTTFDITWDQQVQEIVRNPLKIILMQNDNDLGIIADDIDPESGSYPWTAATYQGGTAAPGTGYKIKIKDSVTGEELDTSDSPFTISDQSALTVTSPNGGENWLPGSTENITWTASNISNPVKITLWQNGIEQGTIAQDLDPISSPYPWTVAKLMDDSWVDPGPGYTIKIEEQGTAISDTSDTSFTISNDPTVTVTSPNGGETWPPGLIRYITWNYNNLTYGLKITLWKDGILQGTIIDNLDYISGSYSWYVGSYDGGTAGPGPGYTIKIEEIGTSVSDTGDAPFTISDQSSISVTSPNGGEYRQMGVTYDICWTSSGMSGDVNIALYKGGVLHSNIGTADVSSGCFSWDIPLNSDAGYDYKVRIYQGTMEDYSDNDFSLHPAKADFNGDGKSEVIWRYNAQAGYNAVWLLDTVGGTAGTAGYQNKTSPTSMPAIKYSRTGPIQKVVWESLAKPGAKPIKDGFQGQKNKNTNARSGLEHFAPYNKQNRDISRVMVSSVTDPRDDPQSVDLPSMLYEDWKLAGTGDFNGDGNVDIVWSNVGNAFNCVWYMDGTTFLGQGQLPDGSTTDWVLGGVGDFDRDGKPDLIWHNEADGRNGVWYMDGVQLKDIDIMTTGASVDWKLCGTGYFNNDSHVDLVWRNTLDGRNAVWYMDGVELSSVGWLDSVGDQNWELRGMGDFDNDGKSDLIWRYMSGGDGRNCIWYLDGVTFISSEFLTKVTDIAWIIENN